MRNEVREYQPHPSATTFLRDVYKSAKERKDETAILAPGSRGRRLSKRLLQVVITLFGLLLLTFTIGPRHAHRPGLAIVRPGC
ncbi:putative dipeptide ABC transport system periplasmic binding component [Klebsiella pneumoniae]|uniref:Putative dipeptide ABC transport system periplasmic binding component n=1 Tax=Klebsiella pneumoniae TaxID=573 RepID=A0A378FYI3_KLEPN|nr:putative dipeptide ABC transport system periplasmic binding component [Klebsiella pneumoniae]